MEEIDNRSLEHFKFILYQDHLAENIYKKLTMTQLLKLRKKKLFENSVDIYISRLRAVDPSLPNWKGNLNDDLYFLKNYPSVLSRLHVLRFPIVRNHKTFELFSHFVQKSKQLKEIELGVKLCKKALICSDYIAKQSCLESLKITSIYKCTFSAIYVRNGKALRQFLRILFANCPQLKHLAVPVHCANHEDHREVMFPTSSSAPVSTLFNDSCLLICDGSRLVSIDLSGTQVTDVGVTKFLRNCKNLQILLLPDTEITTNTLYAVGTHCPELRALNVSRCSNMRRTLQGLLAVTQYCPKLTKLHHTQQLRWLLLNETDMVELFKPLRNSTKQLENLAITFHVSSAGAESFLRSFEQFLRGSSSLHHLGLVVIFTQVYDGQYTFRSVARCCRELRTLSLSEHNLMTIEVRFEVDDFIQLLRNNVHLTDVSLSIPIAKEDVLRLCRHVTSHHGDQLQKFALKDRGGGYSQECKDILKEKFILDGTARNSLKCRRRQNFV